MITRREFVIALGASAFAVPIASLAQQPPAEVSRIGFLIAESASAQASRVDALRAGLRDLGYVEGKNVVFEIREAEGNYDRLPELAAELARLRVDVLVTFATKASRAAKRATTTIPIVFPAMGDPIAYGMMSNLARPGGNITGLSFFGPEVAAKRLELLKEAVPGISHVAALLNPRNPGSGPTLQAMRGAAKLLKLELRTFEMRTPGEIGSTFSAIAKEHFDAIVVQQDTLFIINAKEIAELAARQRLPSAGTKEFAEAGGLIGYGADIAEMYRRAAVFVDKILKGANPGDLPIEGATRFETVINMKTAKVLSIKTMPTSILVQATRVIE